MRLYDLDDLIGAQQIAEMAGVTKAAVSNWQTSQKGSKGFPEPIVTIDGRRFWSRVQIKDWLRDQIGDLDQQIAALQLRRNTMAKGIQ